MLISNNSQVNRKIIDRISIDQFQLNLFEYQAKMQ